MKKLFSIFMVALMVATITSCKNGGAAGNDAASKTEDSIATEFGKLIGQNLKMQMSQDPRAVEQIDKEELLRGIDMVLNADTTKRGKSFINGIAVAMQMIYPGIAQMEGQGLNIDRKALINELKKSFKSNDSVDINQLQTMQMNLQGMMQRATAAKGAKNDKEGKKYLEEQMKKDKGFKKTASGLAYKVVKEGAGENFNDSATVDVTYVGKHIDGKEFDSSKGKPVPFNLKMTVPGFREVISNMKPGTKAIAIIPGALAYGDQGNPQGGIGPNETLVFEITAIGVHKEEPSAMPGMPGRPAAAPAPKPAPAAKK